MNQYRCETCEHHDNLFIPTDGDTSQKWQYCKITQSTLCNNELELIEKIGCASHSDLTDLLSVSSPTSCPVCGAQVMRHFWCIDDDCRWDSIKEERLRRQEIRGMASEKDRIERLQNTYHTTRPDPETIKKAQDISREINK